MSRVLWHTTMSIDGFVASRDGDISWMQRYAGPNPAVTDVLGEIGAVIIGRRTYVGNPQQPGAGDPDGQAYGGAWSGPQFVLSRTLGSAGQATVIGDVSVAVAAASAAAGDKYVSILGAETARSILEAGLLDEVLVHIVPVLLGDGVRLLSSTGPSLPLFGDSVTATQAGQVVNVRMRVPR